MQKTFELENARYRGFSNKRKKWLYGSLWMCNGKYYILPNVVRNSEQINLEDFIVNKITIGMYIGEDSDGYSLYTGDTVDIVWNDDSSEIGVVSFDTNKYSYHVYLDCKGSAVSMKADIYYCYRGNVFNLKDKE